MSLQQTIKEINTEIDSIKNEISKYQHPEEKLQRAREEYQDALNSRAQYIIDCHMKLQELESQLKKPVEEYATKYQRGRRIITNPIAREVSRLRAVSGDNRYSVDYHYKEMCERKDILDNFNGYMTDAERRLIAAQENLAMYSALIRKSEEKKRPKKERPVHVIKIDPYVKDGGIAGYNVSQDDIREVAKNGARGISITFGEKMINIKKSDLKDIMNGFNYQKIDVTTHGLSFFNNPGSYVFFKWKERNHWNDEKFIYPEANIEIPCLDKGGN